MKLNNDIYINEPHISGGVPISSKTDKGVRFNEHGGSSDSIEGASPLRQNRYAQTVYPQGTTLWRFDLEGKIVDDYQDTTVFGEGSIQHDRAARFTGKPYDKEMGAYIFPYRNYNPIIMRWRSADPSGYPDGINNQFYACVPTMSIDPLGLWVVQIGFTAGYYTGSGMGVEAGLTTSLTASVGISGSDAVEALSGVAQSVGDSIGEGIVGGIDGNIPFGEDDYSGSLSVGIGVGTPVELHYLITETILSQIIQLGGTIEK